MQENIYNNLLNAKLVLKATRKQKAFRTEAEMVHCFFPPHRNSICLASSASITLVETIEFPLINCSSTLTKTA